MARAHLQKQLKDLMKHPVGGVKVEATDLMKWDVYLLGPDQTPYEGGCFRAALSFTEEFPMKPPELRFISEFWHPNVYPDGVVCISILHPPGVDSLNALESASMRWTPVQSLEKVLLSVISMIADPDPSEAGAPANVDALVEWRRNRTEYVARVRKLVEKANKSLPAGFELPSREDSKPPPPPEAEFTLFEEDGDDADFECDEDDSCGEVDDGDEAMPDDGFTSEVQQLRAMGIPGDDSELLDALQKCKGDVERVVELLASKG
eukprot:TRINITY_DN2526_c0_g1_i1.p2 TRINITY_DN2526_c0_g1~~TRINITY_DN2526_c0_g1_i1.p2  ORF type:complete len:286 (+),score=115.99 TRINITY_DN2526_c0_g1_i1:70-858(+)